MLPQPKMNRKCWIGLAVLIALLVVGGPAVWGYHEPRESLCAQGNALRSARLLDKAEETYASGGRCAGLSGVERAEAKAEEHFGIASVYASARPESPASSKKAIDHFAAGLGLDPYEGQANRGLTAELNKRLVDPAVQCETGANLVEDGLLTVAGVALANGLAAKIELCETTVGALAAQQRKASRHLVEAHGLDGGDARQAYASALGANANLAAARTDLEGSLDDDSYLDEVSSAIADIAAALKMALAWLVPLAIGLLLLALLAWLAVREAAARWSWARKSFEGLGRHPGLSFLFYKAAVPDIEVTPFEGKGESGLAGADFSTMLKGEIYRTPARGPAFPFDRVPGGPEPHATAGVTAFKLMTEIPATTLLGSILETISKLFRRRKVLLTGHLTPPADKGAGVLLSVKGGRGNDASRTLWELVYDPQPGGTGAVRWLRLLPAATIWSLRYLDRAQDPAKYKKLEAQGEADGLDPDAWEAEALFKSAEAWELKGDPSRAEALYAAALESDEGLLPAAHNLALVEIRRGSYTQALERLEALRTVLEEGESCGRSSGEMRCLWPTLEAASLYTLILTLAYLERDPSEARRDRGRPTAIATARRLVSTMARALASKEAETDEKRRKGTATGGSKKPVAERTEDERERELQALFEVTEHPTVVVLASLTVKNEPKHDRETAVEQAVSADPDVEAVTRAQLQHSLPSLKPWGLVHGYVERQPNLPRRTHYNLACYYAGLLEYAERDQRAKIRERALKSLGAGLVGGELVEWARKDPSLDPLKEFRPYEFADVLAGRAIEPHTDNQGSPAQ